MPLVDVADLKKNLRKHLKRVKDGKEIVIVERGRPVAKLVPFAEDRIGEQDLAFVGRAKMRLSKKQLDVEKFLKMPAPRVSGRTAVQALLDDRDEGF